MKTTIDYLNEAKKVLGIESDYGIAKFLGISNASTSRYMSGDRIIDDYAASKIAGVLGIDPMMVIAAANAEREKTADRKEYWKNFYERLGGVAAGFAFVTFIVTASPAPASADGLLTSIQCILC